jgi:hypothetical protein
MNLLMVQIDYNGLITSRCIRMCCNMALEGEYYVVSTAKSLRALEGRLSDHHDLR